MPDYRDFQYHGPPRSVRGGIRAQTKHGAFGKSWWGRRWLETLESFNLGGRLQRAKAYARGGQVITLEISEGKVTALVQGSRKDPYSVTIEMQTISAPEWEELARTSFNQAIVAARLLSGAMPENVETLFSERKLSLFPARKADLQTHCTCPDYANPCKHSAAVYLLLAEEFDREPFLIFKLRGMSRTKLLRLLFSSSGGGAVISKDIGARGKSHRGKAKDAKPESSDVMPESAAKGGTAEGKKKLGQIFSAPVRPQASVEFLPTSAGAFWHTKPIDRQLIPPAKIPQTSIRLLKTIGTPPFWRSQERFMEAMTAIYDNASKYATKLLEDE